MPQSVEFLLNILYTGVFVLFFAIGLIYFVLHRPLGTVRQLQKQFGTVLMLLSLHIIYIYYNSTAHENDDVVHIIGLVLVGIDILCVAFTLAPAIRWFKKYNNDESETKAPVISSEQEETPVVSMPSEQLKPADQSEAVTEEKKKDADEEAAESNEEPQETEESADEAENVKPLESTSIEDLIFFQKVEALMAQKRLFSEPEISREMIAAEIGTNRTYLARSIKNATGKTFLEYITDLRTSYAATLLTTTNEPLDMIGTLVGFRSKSAYYRAFSAAYNCTPSDYRKRSKNRD